MKHHPRRGRRDDPPWMRPQAVADLARLKGDIDRISRDAAKVAESMRKAGAAIKAFQMHIGGIIATYEGEPITLTIRTGTGVEKP